MNIGQAAIASGVSAKLIRYYEQIGLVQAADRTGGNYRRFGQREVDELRFIRRARGLGYTVEEIRSLLALWRDPALPAAGAKAEVDGHLADLEARLAEMQTMAQILRDLAASCAEGTRPEFPSQSDPPSDSLPPPRLRSRK
jgi:Cu(I)-responsive transcriptional regulator